MQVREELNQVKTKLSLRTDQELADSIKTNKRNIESWVKRNHIPDKWRMIMGGLVNPDAKLPLLKHDVELSFYPTINASAGYGCTNEEVESETMEVSRFFLKTLGVTNAQNIDVIRIYGDSMEPDFHNGEYVVVERVQGVEQVNNGNTVIARIDNELYIKQLQKIPFEKTIILKSTNPTYKEITIPEKNQKDLNIVGIARGIIKPL